MRCQECGLVRVRSHPEQSELNALYGESYYRSRNSRHLGYTDYVADEANIRRTARRRLRQLQRHAVKGRLLDIGCATGFFLDEAQKAGWSVTGLDPSDFAVQYARNHFGLDVLHGTLENVNLPAQSFDLVTMWDVIEHVSDPAGCIRQVRRLLRDDGVLTLATPNVESIPARLAGRAWVGYKLSGEHVTFFSKRTLSQMLDSAGFTVLQTRHIGKHVSLALFRNRLGMYFPLMARLLNVVEDLAGLSTLSLYVNPFDIIQVTARKGTGST
ncbi:MAG: class I SAM-dependent methyltransferase [Anaerolineaceae bacterium]|nr:class I SAM-dependent methyltransferase [Anaerolineaceae bacterium]